MPYIIPYIARRPERLSKLGDASGHDTYAPVASSAAAHPEVRQSTDAPIRRLAARFRDPALPGPHERQGLRDADERVQTWRRIRLCVDVRLRRPMGQEHPRRG